MPRDGWAALHCGAMGLSVVSDCGISWSYSFTIFYGRHTALHFGVKAKVSQDRVPTLHWLPKLHKKTYKARFIANSSSCTLTELSKSLTSCLAAVKKRVIKYCEKVYERSGKNLFWSIKNSGEILDKLKARDFNATSLSTYDFFYSLHHFTS